MVAAALFVSTPSLSQRFAHSKTQTALSTSFCNPTRARNPTLWRVTPKRRSAAIATTVTMSAPDAPDAPGVPDSPGVPDAPDTAEVGEDVIFDDEIKEPYPGFFADMKRMGMTDEEARAQALKQMKQSNPVKSDRVGGAKNLFREDGTAYAPWMADFPTEYSNKVIKQRTDATGRLAADPQRGELSGVGITWKVVGDNDALELSWATGSEDGNAGFVVYRRRGKSDNWEKLADYRSKPVELKTKGPEGGAYKFSVPDPEPGTWVYRISDVDTNNQVADLSQVLVEIESPEDSKIQKIALVGLLIILAIAFGIGVFLDPQSSLSS